MSYLTIRGSSVSDQASGVCVIVVNFNGGGFIRRCMDAIGAQTCPPDRVIVADNGSSDGSVDGLEAAYPGFEVLRLRRNLGFAEANNIAVREASGMRWVALLNPDAFPQPTWLERMLDAAERHPEAAFFGCRLLLADRPDILDGTGDLYHVSGAAWRRFHGVPAERVAPEEEEIFSPCAAAALYSREAFLGIGGFDDRFFCYLEDVDLGFRLRLAGFRARSVSNAAVLHLGSATTGTLSDFSLYQIQRNLVWAFVKNMPLPLLIRYLPQHLLLNLMGVLALTRRGKGLVALRAKRDAVAALPGVWRDRCRIQRERRVAPGALSAIFARGLLTPYRREKHLIP